MSGGRTQTPGPLTQSVADLLDETRRIRGLTTHELGVRSGISQSQMSKFLRAQRVLNVEQMDRVCRVLGLSIVEVLDAADFRTRDRF